MIFHLFLFLQDGIFLLPQPVKSGFIKENFGGVLALLLVRKYFQQYSINSILNKSTSNVGCNPKTTTITDKIKPQLQAYERKNDGYSFAFHHWMQMSSTTVTQNYRES